MFTLKGYPNIKVPALEVNHNGLIFSPPDWLKSFEFEVSSYKEKFYVNISGKNKYQKPISTIASFEEYILYDGEGFKVLNGSEFFKLYDRKG